MTSAPDFLACLVRPEAISLDLLAYPSSTCLVEGSTREGLGKNRNTRGLVFYSGSRWCPVYLRAMNPVGTTVYLALLLTSCTMILHSNSVSTPSTHFLTCVCPSPQPHGVRPVQLGLAMVFVNGSRFNIILLRQGLNDPSLLSPR